MRSPYFYFNCIEIFHSFYIMYITVYILDMFTIMWSWGDINNTERVKMRKTNSHTLLEMYRGGGQYTLL